MSPTEMHELTTHLNANTPATAIEVIDRRSNAGPWTEDTMRLSDSTVRGRTVISADGTAVGTIAELLISASDWRIESIRIELRNDVADRIGSKRTIFHHATIELPVTFVQSVSDAVVLTVDVGHLREAHRPTAAEAAPPPTT